MFTFRRRCPSSLPPPNTNTATPSGKDVDGELEDGELEEAETLAPVKIEDSLAREEAHAETETTPAEEA